MWLSRARLCFFVAHDAWINYLLLTMLFLHLQKIIILNIFMMPKLSITYCILAQVLWGQVISSQLLIWLPNFKTGMMVLLNPYLCSIHIGNPLYAYIMWPVFYSFYSVCYILLAMPNFHPELYLLPLYKHIVTIGSLVQLICIAVDVVGSFLLVSLFLSFWGSLTCILLSKTLCFV